MNDLLSAGIRKIQSFLQHHRQLSGVSSLSPPYSHFETLLTILHPRKCKIFCTLQINEPRLCLVSECSQTNSLFVVGGVLWLFVVVLVFCFVFVKQVYLVIDFPLVAGLGKPCLMPPLFPQGD